MCANASRQEINNFLQEVKKIIAKDGFDFIPRDKNMRALAAARLTILDAKYEILDLTAKDYYKGPKKDFDRHGYIWEFKKLIDGNVFYIKLKIEETSRGKQVKCIGFHRDDFS